MHSAPCSSKFSYIAAEDMEVTSVKGKPWPHYTFLFSLYRYVSDISLLGTFSETQVTNSDKAIISTIDIVVEPIRPEPELL